MPERYEKAEAQIGTGQQGWVVFEQHAATWLAWVRTEAEADLIVSALNNLATAKAGLETIRKLGITHASEIARATLAAMEPEAGA